MNLSNFIKNIQNKPLKTRLRIIWLTTGVCAVALVAIFIYNLKSELNSIDGDPLVIDKPENKESTSNYTTAERADFAEGSVQIFFKVNNNTDDILNFSKLEAIKLIADDKTIEPTKITDRQGKPFFAKILSHTEVFGIITFPIGNAESGTLTLDDMFFETRPESIFQQEIDLDFEQLKKSQELRG